MPFCSDIPALCAVTIFLCLLILSGLYFVTNKANLTFEIIINDIYYVFSFQLMKLVGKHKTKVIDVDPDMDKEWQVNE